MKFFKGSNKEKDVEERVCAYPWSISRPLFKLFLFSCSYRSCSCCRRSSSRSRAMRSASLRRSWETRRLHSELQCNIKNTQTTLNFSQKPNCIHFFLWATAPARYGLSLFPASPAPGAPSPASVSPSPVSVAPAAGSLVLLAPAWYGRVHGVHVQQFLGALKKKRNRKKRKAISSWEKPTKPFVISFYWILLSKIPSQLQGSLGALHACHSFTHPLLLHLLKGQDVFPSVHVHERSLFGL